MSQAGLKPAASCLEDRRSDSTELLAPNFIFSSQAFLLIEIEWISRDSNPDLTACKTVALPDFELLTREEKISLGRRIRTPATSAQDSDASKLHHTQSEKFVGGPGETRTLNSRLKRPVLLPFEFLTRMKRGGTGDEIRTRISSLADSRSCPVELLPHGN